MKALVLGGGGFIGSNISDKLLSEGYSVRIFEHESVSPYRSFTSNDDVEWIAGDFLDPDALDRAVKGMDLVYHLISTTVPHISINDPVYDFQSNVSGALNLIRSINKHGVGRVIFSSSGGTVYGIPQSIPIDETHPTNPIVPYGITKLSIEKYLQMYAEQMNFKALILRVSNPYGPRQHSKKSQGAIGIFLDKIINSEPIEIWGDGSTVRDYVYIDDVVDAFSKAALYSGDYQVFNIGSGIGTSLKDVLSIAENVTGKPVEYPLKDSRAYDIPVNILSAERARHEISWTASVSLEDGIRKTYAHMQ